MTELPAAVHADDDGRRGGDPADPIESRTETHVTSNACRLRSQHLSTGARVLTRTSSNGNRLHLR